MSRVNWSLKIYLKIVIRKKQFENLRPECFITQNAFNLKALYQIVKHLAITIAATKETAPGRRRGWHFVNKQAHKQSNLASLRAPTAKRSVDQKIETIQNTSDSPRIN